MSNQAIAHLDQEIEAARRELEALELARDALARRRGIAPLQHPAPAAPADAGSRGRGARNTGDGCDLACDACSADFFRASCKHCDFTAQRCSVHGGGKGAGGVVAGHTRHTHAVDRGATQDQG